MGRSGSPKGWGTLLLTIFASRSVYADPVVHCNAIREASRKAAADSYNASMLCIFF